MPSPNTTPSSGAPASPAAGRQDGCQVRWVPQRQRDDHDAADAHQQQPVGEQGSPHRRRRGRHGDEDDAEAEDEQQRAEQQPAPATLLQRDVGQPGHVAEEARHQGQHAG
jgi:hypothetical protein